VYYTFVQNVSLLSSFGNSFTQRPSSIEPQPQSRVLSRIYLLSFPYRSFFKGLWGTLSLRMILGFSFIIIWKFVHTTPFTNRPASHRGVRFPRIHLLSSPYRYFFKGNRTSIVIGGSFVDTKLGRLKRSVPSTEYISDRPRTSAHIPLPEHHLHR
jgi:hypothetical protein